jgi:hypothetical protein
MLQPEAIADELITFVDSPQVGSPMASPVGQWSPAWLVDSSDAAD